MSPKSQQTLATFLISRKYIKIKSTEKITLNLNPKKNPEAKEYSRIIQKIEK